MSQRKPKLLVVDDEPSILDALVRGLRGAYDIRTATSGALGLELLAREPDVAVVMSDMRMPLMSGAAFLARVSETSPDSVRVLLTGQADVEDAILAINEGHIFRFLRKPCAIELMRSTLRAAAAQHQLVTAERQLLEQTLRGAVQALSDTLALANPTVFGSALRVKRVASALASELGVTETWPLEVASMVCRLGAIALPPGLYERRAETSALTAAERAMLERVPVTTEQLLAPIPRLEPVRELLQSARHLPVPGVERAVAARILRAALDFDELASTSSSSRAVNRMRGTESLYGRDVLDALGRMFERPEADAVDVPVLRLREGMIIAADILSKTGVLLVARGHEVTPSLLERLRNFAGSLSRDTICVQP